MKSFRGKYLFTTLALILIVSICFVATACGDDSKNEPSAPSLGVADVSSYELEDGNVKSSYALGEELDLSQTYLKIYLVEDSAYLAYLLEGNGEYRVSTDDGGKFIRIKATDDLVDGFSTQEVVENATFTLSYLSFSKTFTYSVVDASTVTVNYELNGGEFTTATYGDVTISTPALTFARETGLENLIGAKKNYHEFKGWLFNGEIVESIPKDLEVNSITLSAIWEEIEYTLSFDTKYGKIDDIVYTCSYPDGEITLPTLTPAIVGNEQFVGWYEDDNYTKKIEIFQVIPCKDATLYARWSERREVTLEGDFATSIRSGSKTIDFSKAYFKVVGQDEEKEIKVSDKSVKTPEFELETVGEYTVNFIVEYDGLEYSVEYSYEITPADVYFIKFETDGGTLPQDAPVFFDANGLETLPEAQKLGYDFDGWYDTQNFKTKVTGVAANTSKDVTVYAKYVEHEYAINYFLGAQSINYQDSFTISDLAEGKELWTGFTVEGYHFIAWHYSLDFTKDNALSFVPEGTFQDINVYAETGKKVESIAVSSPSSFDVKDSLTLTATVLPQDAYYKDYVFEIVSDDDMTGAVIENNVLSTQNFGTIGIRAYLDGVYSDTVYVSAIDNDIQTIEILPNDEGRYVAFAGPADAIPVNVKIKVGPDPNASLEGHTLFYHFVPDESKGYVRKEGISLSNSIVTYDGYYVGNTTITVSNASYYGEFTLYVEMDPEIDPMNDGQYKVDSGKIVASQVFTIPTPITTPQQLAAIDKDGYYVLASDLDMSYFVGGWTPLCSAQKTDGAGLDYDNAFNGYFNGNGKTISNLAINHTGDYKTDLPTVGLFGAVGAKGVVKNFTLKDVNVVGEYDDGVIVGAAVASIDRGSVSDIKVSGVMTIKGGSMIGGVVGRTSGTVKNVSAGYDQNTLYYIFNPIEDTVLNNYYLGGAVAYSANGTADKLSAVLDADVTIYSKDNVYFGGAVGYLLGNLSSADVSIKLYMHEFDAKNGAAALVDVGGAVGYSKSVLSKLTVGNKDVASIFNFTLPTTAKATIGGAVGESTEGIFDSAVTSAISVSDAKSLTLGGVFGSSAGGSALSFTGNMDIASTSTTAHNIGGIGAKSTGDASGTFIAYALTFDLKADYTFGGIVADAGKAMVGGSSTLEDLSSTSNGTTFGGLVGKTTGGILENGDVRVSGTFILTDTKAAIIGVLAGTLSGEANSSIACATLTVDAYKAANVSVGAIGTASNANANKIESWLDLTVNSQRELVDGKETKAGGATLTAGSIAAKTSGGAKFEMKDLVGTLKISAVCLGASNGSITVGGLIGDNAVSVTNAEVSGEINVKAIKEMTVGGAVGKNSGNLTDCTSKVGTIKTDGYSECAKRNVGGLIGDNTGAIVHSNSSTSIKGNTTGAGKIANVGGFVGNNSGSVQSSYVGKFDDNGYRLDNAVEIEETVGNDANVLVGGFVGNNSAAKASIENCYTDAYIRSSANIGGFVGSNTGKIAYSLALGSIENVDSITTTGAFAFTAVDKCVFVSCLVDSRLGTVNILNGSDSDNVVSYSTLVLKRYAYADFDQDVWDVEQGRLPKIK